MKCGVCDSGALACHRAPRPGLLEALCMCACVHVYLWGRVCAYVYAYVGAWVCVCEHISLYDAALGKSLPLPRSAEGALGGPLGTRCSKEERAALFPLSCRQRGLRLRLCEARSSQGHASLLPWHVGTGCHRTVGTQTCDSSCCNSHSWALGIHRATPLGTLGTQQVVTGLRRDREQRATVRESSLVCP